MSNKDLNVFLKYGANPNVLDQWSFTPLHEAIIKNRYEVCSLLLSYKAQPYLANCYKKNAFDLAHEQNVEFGEQLYLEYLAYSLFDAINENDFIKIKRLFNKSLYESPLTVNMNDNNATLVNNLNTNTTTTINNNNNNNNSESNNTDSIANILNNNINLGESINLNEKYRKLSNFKHCRTHETPLVNYFALFNFKMYFKRINLKKI